ncbi:MAG: hypothetical protein ACFE85_00975 [Candidatus Hodarchaeota archaeon]
MIVIFVDNIENFLTFLERRVMNEIFYEFKETKNNIDLSTGFKIEIILHFLAKINNSLILYETKQTISRPQNVDIDEEVIETLQKLFSQVDSSINLIKGKIREIFLSYSS